VPQKRVQNAMLTEKSITMINGITQNIFTYQLNASSITIDETYGLTAVSMVLTAGTGSFAGTAFLANGVASTPIDLVINQPISIPSQSGAPLTNLTITTTGIVSILGYQ
jgi:hypothetical protein